MAFGVLDLPGFDGLIGVGFLNQFLPYSIQVNSATDKIVRFTTPKSKEVIQVRGVSPSTVYSRLDVGVPEPPESPVSLAVQWEAPSATDLA